MQFFLPPPTGRLMLSQSPNNKFPLELAFTLEASYTLHHLPFLYLSFIHYIVASLGQVFCQHLLLTSPVSCLCPALLTGGNRGKGAGKYFGALQAYSATVKTSVCYQHV